MHAKIVAVVLGLMGPLLLAAPADGAVLPRGALAPPCLPGPEHSDRRDRGVPAGFAKVTAPEMVRVMRRANTKDLARLETVLEPDDIGT
jgi:hypothetical protein